MFPYDFIYCKFEYDVDNQCADSKVKGIYKEYPLPEESKVVVNGFDDAAIEENMPVARVFRGVDRLKLMHNIISSNEMGGCGLDTYRLVKDECILGYFPLHDNVELRALESKWLLFFQFPWHQATDAVKDYYGEKIGLYFTFLGHYTTFLFPAAIMGVMCWISVAVNGNNPNSLLMPYFGALMALWSTVLLEYWKRTEIYTAMKWGMVGFEAEEVDRPQFYGEKRKSPVDGHPYTYFPEDERFNRAIRSNLIISGLCFVVLGVIACIFALRVVMTANKSLAFGGIELGGIIASILNALQIQVSVF